MRLSAGAALLAILFGASGVAAAQPAAKSGQAPRASVEAVQLSASVERGKQVVPLGPGMELRDGDRVNTGERSRLILKLVDGSTVKLGERSSLFVDRIQVRNDGVFEAALFVAEGAFRFTTAALDRFAGKRQISIAVNNVTAGIRGTDLWGKSTPESEIVCVIQGSVEVSPPGEKPFTIDQPLSYYTLEGTVSRPVASVPADRFAEWAAETEEAPGQGVSRPGGRWKVTVASVRKSGEALDVYNQLRRAGYPAEIVPAKAGDARIYSVRISNFESEKDAKAVVEALKAQADLAKHDYKVGM
jgi:hypothetical protein